MSHRPDAVIRMPLELEERRSEFNDALIEAAKIVREFAEKYDWTPLTEQPFFNSVEVFSNQNALWRRALELDELPEDCELPTDGLSATLVNGVLLLLKPEEYFRIRPSYAAVPSSWARLIAHELIHELHLRIVGNDPDRMGPQWFFEGLAFVAANQDADQPVLIQTVEEALDYAKFRGSGSYLKNAAAVRFFMARRPLPELIRRAGEAAFEDWLRTI